VAVTSDRERARSILNAVRALPVGVLDAAIAAAPGEERSRLAVVRAALDAPDPEAAVTESMRDVAATSAEQRAHVNGLLRAATQISVSAGRAGAMLASAREGRDLLAAIGVRSRASAAADTDPARVALLDDALALLGNDTPFAALENAISAIAEADRLLDSVGTEMDGAVATRNVAALRGHRAALAEAQRAFSSVPVLVAEARAQAVTRGDAVRAAQLAVTEAALRDHEDGAAERWHAALEAALAAEQVRLAAAAASRIELAAIAGGALAPIIETAPKIAELAAKLGDVDTELGALGDEALARLQVPGGEERAAELLERAHLVAGDDALRVIRVNLLDAQIQERLGDKARARKLYREIMQYGRDIDGAGHALGWAALHLGRLELEMGHTHRARQDLELAHQIGDAADDPALVALAAGARLDLATDRDAANAIVAAATKAGPEARDELARRVSARWGIVVL